MSVTLGLFANRETPAAVTGCWKAFHINCAKPRSERGVRSWCWPRRLYKLKCLCEKHGVGLVVASSFWQPPQADVRPECLQFVVAPAISANVKDSSQPSLVPTIPSKLAKVEGAIEKLQKISER
ncbi:uncharacterized protein LOC126299099 [Schistocerca gregaria]|uniref:uncharacterized protein LOC126299099 n=1 Tax=Schistocerca gregaria TaxID=7010 RepID=UPI00211DF194|nr:uncharacterized protein LOC126299099 [Schistocerca gregaria]